MIAVRYTYGSIPRLLLFWITTEAVRTKARRIEFGRSLTAFMLELGLRDCLATHPINRIVNQAPLCTAFDYYRPAEEVSDKRRDILGNRSDPLLRN